MFYNDVGSADLAGAGPVPVRNPNGREIVNASILVADGHRARPC